MAALALVGRGKAMARARRRFLAREFFKDDLAGLAVSNLSGIDDAGAIFSTDNDPVQKDEHGKCEVQVEKRFGRRELEDAALLVEAVEAGGAQFDEAGFESLGERRRCCGAAL